MRRLPRRDPLQNRAFHDRSLSALLPLTLLIGTLSGGILFRLAVGRKRAPALSGSKLLAEFRETSLPNRRRKNDLVDHPAGFAPMLDVEHRLDIGSAVPGKALIGPAQRMRRQDDSIQ